MNWLILCQGMEGDKELPVTFINSHHRPVGVRIPKGSSNRNHEGSFHCKRTKLITSVKSGILITRFNTYHHNGWIGSALMPRSTSLYLQSNILGIASPISRCFPVLSYLPDQSISAAAAALGQSFMSIVIGSLCSLQRATSPPSTDLVSLFVKLYVMS